MLHPTRHPMRSFSRLLLLLPLICAASCAPRDESASVDGPAATSTAAVPAAQIPESIRPRIDAALHNVESRELEPSFGFWTIFHGILGLGPDVMLVDRKTGERIKALDLVSTGSGIPGLEFVPEGDGIDVVTMAGSGMGQGHQDQFVAEMVEWGVPAHRPVT